MEVDASPHHSISRHRKMRSNPQAPTQWAKVGTAGGWRPWGGEGGQWVVVGTCQDVQWVVWFYTPNPHPNPNPRIQPGIAAMSQGKSD